MHLKLHTSIAAAAAAAVTLVGVSQAFAMGGNLATKGEAILTDNCSKCHSVGAEGDSKIATVKPFREVVAPLPVEGIGDAFVAAMSKKHPEFKFEVMDVKAIGDYLEKLKLHLEKK